MVYPVLLCLPQVPGCVCPLLSQGPMITREGLPSAFVSSAGSGMCLPTPVTVPDDYLRGAALCSCTVLYVSELVPTTCSLYAFCTKCGNPFVAPPVLLVTTLG